MDKPLIQEYLYNNWISGPPSVGGHAHTSLLKPGAWAKKPLELRIPNMKVANINFVYGVQDWMTPGNAFRLQQTVAARRLAGGYAEADVGSGASSGRGSGGDGGPNIAVSLIGTDECNWLTLGGTPPRSVTEYCTPEQRPLGVALFILIYANVNICAQFIYDVMHQRRCWAPSVARAARSLCRRMRSRYCRRRV